MSSDFKVCFSESMSIFDPISVNPSFLKNRAKTDSVARFFGLK